MKLTSIFFVVMFTLSACGIEPDWSGDWSECEQVVEDACIKGGIRSDDIYRALALSRSVFDTPDQPGATDIDIRGYIIEQVAEPKDTPCGFFAQACVSRLHKHIWVINYNDRLPPCMVHTLGHEFGHIARPSPEDDMHATCVWYEWDINMRWKICPGVVPPLTNKTCY